MLKSELDEALEEDFVVDGLVADDPEVGHHLAHVALDENWLLEAKTNDITLNDKYLKCSVVVVGVR